jgi:hypothetical protein
VSLMEVRRLVIEVQCPTASFGADIGHLSMGKSSVVDNGRIGVCACG